MNAARAMMKWGRLRAKGWKLEESHMSGCLLLCLLLSQLPAAAHHGATWQPIETTTLHWRKDGSPYTLIVEVSTSEVADDVRLRIKVAGRDDFVLSVPGGVVKLGEGMLDKKLAVDNLLTSNYLYLTPKLKNIEGTPMLLVFGWAYGSDPGSLRVLSLDKSGYPLTVFSSRNFELAALIDLDGDGASEIVGKRCLSQMVGTDLSTYDPYSVYRWPRSRAGKAAFSLALSKRYNLKHYYGWAGPDCRDDIMVALHAAKRSPRIINARQAASGSRR